MMRRISFPEGRGHCARPSSLSRGSTAGWRSALSLIYLCEWSSTVIPLAEPARDVLGIFRRELTPRRYQSEKSVI
eukprot:9020968-Pyramimonas_sp.AAC.1